MRVRLEQSAISREDGEEVEDREGDGDGSNDAGDPGGALEGDS